MILLFFYSLFVSHCKIAETFSSNIVLLGNYISLFANKPYFSGKIDHYLLSANHTPKITAAEPMSAMVVIVSPSKK